MSRSVDESLPEHGHILAEINRRMETLPQEIDRWVRYADTNMKGLGIHASQLATIHKVMEDVCSHQASLFVQLQAATKLDDFARHYRNLNAQIVGTSDLWQLFRSIMLQRLDTDSRPALDAASLIAANCYITCIRQVDIIRRVRVRGFRVPALIWVDAGNAPSTVNRGQPVNVLRFRFTHHPRIPLPIPVIMLPTDQLECMWLLSTLHHEVGHHLDQDLGLSSEIRIHLEKCLSRIGMRPQYLPDWHTWVPELIADAIGILLGGAGFAHTMVSLLRYSSEGDRIADSREHPHSWLRIRLLAAMLRHTGVAALAQMSPMIEEAWRLMAPQDAKEYTGQVEQVASLLLTQPLDALNRHPIRDLVPDISGAAAHTAKLASYLLTGENRPSMPHFPHRLVASAAQLAFVSLKVPTPANLATIQQRALSSIEDINRPDKLSSSGRLERTRELARQLRFYDTDE